MLTSAECSDRILLALSETKKFTQSRQHTERYRSGHNEAVLKTVCPQGRVGSNPTLSADKKRPDL